MKSTVLSLGGLLCSVSLLTISQVAWAADAAPAAADAAGAASTVNELVVTAAPREEVRARQIQLASPVLLNVQSAETIAKYPDYNAAEALGRIPGISLSTDTGEGRFVNIRGIDANLNGATYGGVVLLNTFAAGTAASGSGRAVEFDTIPTGAIDGIIVYKTLSPDREAEGLGGQIELTPRSSKNISKPFVEGDLGWGYEPLHDHTGPFTASLAAGARFGFNNGKLVVEGMGDEPPPVTSGWITNPTPFSIVVTASRKDDRRGVDDTEPSYFNDGATCGFSAPGVCDHVLGRADFRYYDYHRRRFGYGSEIDFKPNDDHSYYMRLDVAGYKERVHKNHFYANFDGAPSTPDANGYVVDGFQPQVDIIDAEETHRNTVAVIGGQDNFGKLKIDYHGAYSRATYVENYYDEAKFSGTDTYFGRYNTSNPSHYLYQLFQDAALTIPFVSTDATQYANPRLTAFYESDVDEEYSGVINAQYPVNVFGIDGTVKGGASIRLRDKVVNDFGGFGSATGLLSMYSASVGAGTNYYMGYFPKAPYANVYAIDALVRANLPTLAPSLGRDFNDQENVYAGYLMYTADVGPLGVLTGARIEATDATYGNFLTTTTFDPAHPMDPNFAISTVSPVQRQKSYINVFPTVQLKYLLMPNLQLRATYSTGIARPGFTQAGGNAGVDFTTGAVRPIATSGNPNLQPTTGNNFDFDIEYYMPNGGILQAGFFDKEFKNYIFRSVRLNVVDPIFMGQAGDFVTFINEDAYARGVEIAYHQKFTMLPGLFSGLGVEGNATWVDSRFREYSAAVAGQHIDEYGPLPGTSHLTWNLAGFYENHGLALRLAAEYVGKSLFSLNGDRSIDTIQHQKLNLDFSSSYDFTKQVSGYFDVKNLLNTPLRYDDGNATRPQQIEYYGQTYEFGVRFKF